MIPKERFRTPTGSRYLQGLFYEMVNADKSTVSYTLKDEEHLGFPSLYQCYMETDDPTEYQFAVSHLDGWRHWETLSKCTWFQEYIERWRRELEVRIRSKALARLGTVAASGGKESFSANKYLLEGNWKTAGEIKRGRPTNLALKKEIAVQALEWQETASDYNRLIKDAN